MRAQFCFSLARKGTLRPQGSISGPLLLKIFFMNNKRPVPVWYFSTALFVRMHVSNIRCILRDCQLHTRHTKPQFFNILIKFKFGAVITVDEQQRFIMVYLEIKDISHDAGTYELVFSRVDNFIENLRKKF